MKKLKIRLSVKLKIYYQLLAFFTYEVLWELYWWTDGLHIKFYKWIIKKNK